MPDYSNQHYVWAHYLGAWAHGNFHCYRQREKKLFSGQPKGVANERDFYRTHRLTDGDREYLRRLVEKGSRPDTRTSNEGFVRLFNLTYELRDRIEDLTLPADKREEAEKALKDAERTLGERYHTEIEHDAITHLDELRQESSAFWSNVEDRTKFVYYLCNQYFRTAAMRDAIIRFPSGIPGHDHERTAPIESHIYAANVGMSIVARSSDYRIVFLRNGSSIPFVAGDQPIVNTRDPIKSVELEFYYPLSPTLALLLTDDRTKTDAGAFEIGSVAVEAYNHMIYRASRDMLFSNDPDYLKALVALPKDIGT